MNDAVRRLIVAVIALGAPTGLVGSWLDAADARYEARLKEGTPQEEEVAIASVAEDGYCTPKLKAIVRRVAGACGLLDQSGRGCQPMEAQKVAQLADDDFNALFRPLSHRASLIQFDADDAELDVGARQLVEKSWADQRGASFFFVVARASPDGKEDYNEKLSAARARGVLDHLQTRFDDPEIKKQVGLMWLGEGFAQLGQEFCQWTRSRDMACTEKEINRSAFVAWIDCAI